MSEIVDSAAAQQQQQLPFGEGSPTLLKYILSYSGRARTHRRAHSRTHVRIPSVTSSARSLRAHSALASDHTSHHSRPNITRGHPPTSTYCSHARAPLKSTPASAHCAIPPSLAVADCCHKGRPSSLTPATVQRACAAPPAERPSLCDPWRPRPHGSPPSAHGRRRRLQSTAIRERAASADVRSRQPAWIWAHAARGASRVRMQHSHPAPAAPPTIDESARPSSS